MQLPDEPILSPRLSKKASGGYSDRLPPSVSYAISSKTIERYPTKFGVWVTHMNGAYNSIFYLAPGGAGEGSQIIKFQLQGQFQRFLYQTLCVLTYLMGFSFCHQGHAPGVGLGGWGLVKNLIFPNMVMWHIKLKGVICLFDLILYVPSTIFQLNRDGSSWVKPVLS